MILFIVYILLSSISLHGQQSLQCSKDFNEIVKITKEKCRSYFQTNVTQNEKEVCKKQLCILTDCLVLAPEIKPTYALINWINDIILNRYPSLRTSLGLTSTTNANGNTGTNTRSVDKSSNSLVSTSNQIPIATTTVNGLPGVSTNTRESLGGGESRRTPVVTDLDDGLPIFETTIRESSRESPTLTQDINRPTGSMSVSPSQGGTDNVLNPSNPSISTDRTGNLSNPSISATRETASVNSLTSSSSTSTTSTSTTTSTTTSATSSSQPTAEPTTPNSSVIDPDVLSGNSTVGIVVGSCYLVSVAAISIQSLILVLA